MGEAATLVADVIRKLMDTGEEVVDLGHGHEIRTLTLPRDADGGVADVRRLQVGGSCVADFAEPEQRRVIVSVNSGGQPAEPVPGRPLDPALASEFLFSSGPILDGRPPDPAHVLGS
jgi:hypothetical protein